jgi:aspartate racemase
MDAQKLKRPLFIGTKFTMTDDYFQSPLQAGGRALTLPTESEQTIIQDIQQQVSSGVINARQKETFAAIIANHPLVDSVILACTELPLIAPQSTPSLPIINPAELQCQAAIEFARQSACKLDLASIPNQTVRSPC